MTTLDDVTKKQAEQSAEQQAAVELVRLAQEQGLSLTGPDGLLKQLAKTVLETALNEGMTAHLGYEKHDPPESGTGNARNGTRSKTAGWLSSQSSCAVGEFEITSRRKPSCRSQQWAGSNAKSRA